MAFRATKVASDPESYFIQPDRSTRFLRIADVMLQADEDPKQFFSHVIRVATNSTWNHSALLFMLSDPPRGFDDTFLVEAMTTGIRVASLRTDMYPLERFNVGIRRLPLDWYVETPKELALHDPEDGEDTHGIDYLRHVRGMALNQLNGLYSKAIIDELTALFLERVAKRYHLLGLSHLAADFANLFEGWDESPDKKDSVVRFICSGLVQYSFFIALRHRIINDSAVPESRDAAMSNLSNMHRVVFQPDPEGIIADYIDQIQRGKLKISDDVPKNVQNFLRTTTPADINNSPNLAWQYVAHHGNVWQLEEVADGYVARDSDEEAVLQLVASQHKSATPQQQQTV